MNLAKRPSVLLDEEIRDLCLSLSCVFKLIYEEPRLLLNVHLQILYFSVVEIAYFSARVFLCFFIT